MGKDNSAAKKSDQNLLGLEAIFFAKFCDFPASKRVLEVYPTRETLRERKEMFPFGEAIYTAIQYPALVGDTLSPPHRKLAMDIGNLLFSENAFDLILCNYILSNIRADFQALQQLHRCLRPEGMAMVNVLIHGESTVKISHGMEEQQNPELPQWAYGADYFERLEAAGLFPLYLKAADFCSDRERFQYQIDFQAALFLAFKFKESRELFVKSLS